MSLSTNLEHLGYNSPDGCVAKGLHREVILVTAARTLKKEESGALIVFDVAAGAVVTLPDVEEGMVFDFLVKTTITSSSAKVITGDAAHFLVGSIMFGADASASETTLINAFAANGSSHVAVTSNGTTTGGKRGTAFRLVGISSTLWAISGVEIGSGAIATPFATS